MALAASHIATIGKPQDPTPDNTNPNNIKKRTD
jgi:hypothetical protein